MQTIAVINQAPGDVDDAELGLWVHAIQRQLLENVAQFWPDAGQMNLILVRHGSSPPFNAFQVVVAPTIRIANDLGFHELTNFGNPQAFVATQLTTQSGQTISRVLSHEIVEMVVNPHLNKNVVIPPHTFAVEACDPVHLDAFGYRIDDVLVSNFVTPRYYHLGSPVADPRNDFMRQLAQPAPFLPRGGALFDPTTGGLVTAPDTSPEELALLAIHEGSRRSRQQKPRQEWRQSVVHTHIAKK